MDAGAADQLLFDIVGVLWAESGLVQIWNGFRETLGHRQFKLEQSPQLFESEATQLRALVVVVRDQVDDCWVADSEPGSDSGSEFMCDPSSEGNPM